MRYSLLLLAILATRPVQAGGFPVGDSQTAPALLPAPSGSQELNRAPLSLAELEQMALENNPTLAGVWSRIDAAEGKRIQAGLYPNPVFGYHATQAGNNGTSGGQGGFISQKFITGGKLGLDQSVAQSEQEEARYQYQGQYRRVMNDVQLQFYEALVAQRVLQLNRQLAEISDGFVAATQELLTNRLATENDVLQAQIEAETVRVALDLAENRYAAAWRRLASVVGVAHLSHAPLAGELERDIPDYEWNSCLEQLLSGHPDLEAASWRVERARRVTRRAEREPVPDLDLFVSVRHQGYNGDNVANIIAGVPIPVFDRNQGNIHKSEAEMVAAQQEYSRIELELQDRLAQVFRRYDDARRQATRYSQSILPQATKSLEIVQRGYKNRQVDYLTLLTSQRTYIRVQLAYLEALGDLRATSVLIEGQLLEKSLSVPAAAPRN